MKNYLKLINFELSRFIKIYIVLAAITIISQIVGVIVLSKSYLSDGHEAIYVDGMSQAAFIEGFGQFSFIHVLQSIWFMGPIALSVAGLIFYVFLIWYRDWFGKNTFIYRLLMLPTSRLNVFFAKATTIMLMVMGLVSLQLVLLLVENRVLKLMVPKVFRMDLDINTIINNSQYLQTLIPQTFTEFILYYGLGLMAISIVFTGILFERSYRLKGIIFAAIYAVLAVTVFVLPIIIEESIQGGFFYMNEVIILEIVLGMIVIASSVWVSNYLLKNKVTV